MYLSADESWKQDDNKKQPEVLKIMKSDKISGLPVVNDDQQLVGAVNFHHLLGIGLE